MKQMYIRTIAPNETFVPANLRDGLIALEATRTSDDVWNLLLEFTYSIGLTELEYVFATDYRDWEKAQFIRTTVTSDWIDHAQSDPDVRKLSVFRTHSVHRLTPVVIGIVYSDDCPDLSDKRRHLWDRSKDFGQTAGFTVPLRMTEPGQAAHIMYGGLHSKEGFDAVLKEHGWAMHALALSAHVRHLELFKSEFLQRNKLTDKQKELLRLVGQGMLDKQIAHELGISFSAVRQRLAIVQQKTGTANRAELAALAMRVGLVADPLLKTHNSRDLTVFLSLGDGGSGVETVEYPPDET
ncbi:MAG: LuxR C-terminal-related transcriptional regulator [Pseudomonadota bacterium]